MLDWDKQEYLQNVRQRHPLVNCLTNNITVNDVANVILACGASPVMASDPRELEDFIGLAQAVDLNVGSMAPEMDLSFETALAVAGRLHKPVVMDPVGAGAAKYRTGMLLRFLEKYPVAVIRGNASEIRALAGEAGQTVGVDAAAGDAVTQETLPARTEMAAGLAKKYHTVVAMSGAWDIITDGEKTLVCKRGVPQMSQITGTGCMLTGLTAAFVGANPEHILEATAAATEMMCLCGEIAYQKTQALQAGLGTMRVQLIDALSLA
jgi:hydroxyethylthiazole kinase